MTEEKFPSLMDDEQFQAWLEMEPEHKEKSEEGDFYHVPIGYLEPDLRFTFEGDIEITIRKQEIIEGLLTLVVRLKVFHPVKKKYLKYDGIASAYIQRVEEGTFRGSTKVVFDESIKATVAACYSEGIKNAAKKIGKRFGSDINRVNVPGQKLKPEEIKHNQEHKRILVLINDAETIPELNKYIDLIGKDDLLQKAFTKKLNTLKKTKS